MAVLVLDPRRRRGPSGPRTCLRFSSPTFNYYAQCARRGGGRRPGNEATSVWVVASAASLFSGQCQCARPSGDIGAGNMCLDASTVSKELHVAP